MRVSVIIPTYNRADLLPRAIESVMAQTYGGMEIIVVDDGSTDRTAEVVAGYPSVVYVREPINRRRATAWATGLRVASGEYINFLDSDDLFLPEKVARQAAFLDANSEAGVVYCRHFVVDEAGVPVGKVGLLPQGDILEYLLCEGCMWPGAPLVRRQCFADLDSVVLVSDWATWLALAHAGCMFACIQAPLGAYRITAGSLSSDVVWLETTMSLPFGELSGDLRARAYGAWHLWLGCEYYGAGLWADGRQHVEKALSFCEHPDLMYTLAGKATDLRVRDPLEFAVGVSRHLLADRLGEFFAWVYLDLALAAYTRGEAARADDCLRKAVDLYRFTVEEFAEQVAGHAVRLPETRVPFVFDHLPVDYLKAAQPYVFENVAAAVAFEEWGRLPPPSCLFDYRRE